MWHQAEPRRKGMNFQGEKLFQEEESAHGKPQR